MMKKKKQKQKKDDQIKRETHMMSNLGLFYLIIVAFLAVPLLGAFVVVLIRGVVDLRYAIIVGGAMLSVIALYLLTRALIRLFRKIRQEGLAANRAAGENLRQGGPVQISVLNGLMTFTYGGQGEGYPPALPGSRENPALLPHPDDAPPHPSSHDSIVRQLRELSVLRKQGVVSEDEFRTIKTRLIDKTGTRDDE